MATTPEEFNSPAETSDRANPTSIVRLADDGSASYGDRAHQVVFSPSGEISVFDRASPGSNERQLNFTIKDGYVYHRNPNYEPGNGESEFLRTEIPDEGMELLMDDGTTMFLSKNDDGTLDVDITSEIGDAGYASGGYHAHFKNVGSGEAFSADNVSTAHTGGDAFRADWERHHDDGGKHGSVAKVWVTAMYPSSVTPDEHSDGRRTQSSGDADLGQALGGFSVRSDRKYDVKSGIGERMRYVFYDLKGEPADAAQAQAELPPLAALEPPASPDLQGLVNVDDTCLAVYDDDAHQITVAPDGRITVLDRAAPGSSDLLKNFFIDDGYVNYRNPQYTEGGEEPEFLRTHIPKGGMELLLSDGTTLLVSPQDDGKVDVAIVNTRTDSLVRIDGAGSNEPWVAGSNVNASSTGGIAFLKGWERHHDDGGKFGTVAKVWVTSMTEPAQEGHERRQLQTTGERDEAQRPGGFSLRSDHKYDVDSGPGSRMRYVFYDLAAITAQTEQLQRAVEDAAARR